MTDGNGTPGLPEQGTGVHNAPWEKTFDDIISPIEEFIHSQTTTGLLLMATTLIALIIANSPLGPSYEEFKSMYAGLSLGDWQLKLSVLHWVNDGLMAFFFFIVGLELKREISVGELANLQKASLPIACAIGSMVLPALIYVAFNLGSTTISGWGAPMATDIAFAIGVLVLLGDKVPKGLISFLIALAIVDDLGAVLVIALFYTSDMALQWLGGACVALALLVFLNLSGVRTIIPYFLIAVVLWFTLLQSAVQTLEDGIHRVQHPLQRLEHIWHLPVSFLVIPTFAFLNAGIPLDAGSLKQTISSPVALGIAGGLLVGKFVGITGTGWPALKLGFARLPTGTTFSQIAGVSFLAGIGFTMAIFIAELGFEEDSPELLMAKTGILLASALAGIIGFTWLYLCSDKDSAGS